ncbi:hypothetical protein [Spirosoma fluviale]|uniref:Uncharacterized protein n=1 Tax=Spirosoma fluviale TaxID=1597977 RepID=A0A286FZT5_9BACT|nr:hypothetical protein [Spirosoma fluviale]SOD88536.1 hypothetical protein SAMN06269250_2716 [Spirosoma fluviale]
METTKLSREGKITVKHFLNTRLKGKQQADGSNAYPLYVRIMVKGQQSDIKSRLTGLIQPEHYDWFKNEYRLFLEQEIKDITTIIKGLNPFNKQDFLIQAVTSSYSQSTTPFTIIIEDCLKDELRYCIVVNDPSTPQDVTLDNRVSIVTLLQQNSLVSLIDWQKPAHLILTLLQEAVPRLFEPLNDLEKKYGPAFGFDSLYNGLYAVHRYQVKPTLSDWHTGTFKKDITNSRTVKVIDQLLKDHYKG